MRTLNAPDDFEGLPPTFRVTAELDILRDDGVFYVTALKTPGVMSSIFKFLE